MSNYQKFHQIVEEYNYIAIFTHAMPDFDALGSQLGLATYLQDNYPNKKIFVLGEDNISFVNKIYPPIAKVSDEELFANPFLAIILDCGDEKRISDVRYQKAEYQIKIDHHEAKTSYGDLQIVEPNRTAAAELVVDVLSVNKAKKISKLSAKYFYSGIVGDSGRFFYETTTPRTLELSAELLETGLDFTREVYHPMYTKSLKSIEIMRYIYNNYTISPKGIAYYFLSTADFERFNIDETQYKEFVNLFSGYVEIPIWVVFAELKSKGYWRASCRSREIRINETCEKFQGGGHKNAAGAIVNNREEALLLIEALDKLIS